jgi:hypothetical protein
MDRLLVRFRRPSYIEWSYSPRYRGERVLSYPEWAVPCRRKNCGAAVGEPCKGADGLHAKRSEDHRLRRKDLLVEAYGTATHPPRDWYHRLMLRVEQRAAVVRLESIAAQQTRDNDNASYARRFALDIGVDPALVARAVNAGHQRARREIQRGHARSEQHYQSRVDRTLEPTKSIQDEED